MKSYFESFRKINDGCCEWKQCKFQTNTTKDTKIHSEFFIRNTSRCPEFTFLSTKRGRRYKKKEKDACHPLCFLFFLHHLYIHSSIGYSERKEKKKRKNVRCNFTIPKVTRAAPASVNNATPAVPIHAYRYEGSINIYVVAREILISLAIRCIPRWEEPLQSTSFLREVFPKRSPPFRDSLLSSFLIVPPLSFFSLSLLSTVRAASLLEEMSLRFVEMIGTLVFTVCIDRNLLLFSSDRRRFHIGEAQLRTLDLIVFLALIEQQPDKRRRWIVYVEASSGSWQPLNNRLYRLMNAGVRARPRCTQERKRVGERERERERERK